MGNRKLQLDDFTLQRITFEFRFSHSYLLWDRAGKIWHNANKIWPELVSKSVQPNQTAFRIGDEFDLTVELDKAYVIAYKPKVKDTLGHFESFLDLISDNLEISSFTRVGTRFVYEKKYEDSELAAEAFLETDILKVPTGKHFNIEGKALSPQAIYSWEDDDKGARCSLQSLKKKLEIEVTKDIDELDSVNIEKCLLAYDIDYFTKKSVSRGQFRVSEWVNQIYHLIKRDSKVILGG